MEKKRLQDSFSWQLKEEGGLSKSFAIYRLKTSDLYGRVVLHVLASTSKCLAIFSVQLEANTDGFCLVRYIQFNLFERIKLRRVEGKQSASPRNSGQQRSSSEQVLLLSENTTSKCVSS